MRRKAATPLFPEKVLTTDLPDALGAIPYATVRAGNTVWTPIYKLSLGIDTYAWLCDAHVKARTAKGWSCKEIGYRPGSLAPFGCDDCSANR